MQLPWLPFTCAALFALALLPAAPAAAQCVPDPVASGGTVTCSGVDPDGLDVSGASNVLVDVLPGAFVGVIRLRTGSVVVGQNGAPARVVKVEVVSTDSPALPLVTMFNYGIVDEVLEIRDRPVSRLLVYNYGRVNGPVMGNLLNFSDAYAGGLSGKMFNAGTVANPQFWADENDFQVTNEAGGVVDGDLQLRLTAYSFDVPNGLTDVLNYRVRNGGLITGNAGVVQPGVAERLGTVTLDAEVVNESTGHIQGRVVMPESRTGAASVAHGLRNSGRIDGGLLMLTHDGDDARLYGNPPGVPATLVNENGGRIGGPIIIPSGRFEQRAGAVFQPGTTLHPSALVRRIGSRAPEVVQGTISIAGTHTVDCVADDPVVSTRTRPSEGRLELLAGATLTLSPSSSCAYQGRMVGLGTLRKTGVGDYLYSGTATHSSTVVQQGRWAANGSQGAVTVEATGTVIGSGRIGNTLVRSGGRLAPGGAPGTLTSGSLSMQSPSVFEFEANASASDLLDVVGTVSLGGATLDARLLAGYTHTPGRAMTLIANDGSDPVVGTFNGLAEGAETLIGGAPFRLRYAAGDGNDVVLFALDPATAVSLAPLPGTPNEGAPLTLTATVTGTAPSGAVTFRDGGAPIAGCVDRPLSTSGSGASASCTTSALAGGTRSLSATYSGDNANRSRSSAEVTVTLNRRPTLSVPVAVSIPEDAVNAPVAITVDDSESGAAALTLWASSGNPGLVSDAALTAGLGGSGASRVLAITPVANAFGSTTLTLAASDPGGASRTADIALTVAPVNDPPGFLLGSNPAHPAGSSGAQSRAGFVSQLSAGPGESAQSVALSVSELEDSAGILADATLAPDGRLSYILSGNAGVARLQAIASDDGGTANGGRDRTQREFRIVVGSGADLQIRLSRVLPDPAPGQRAYRILANNNGPLDLSAVSVRGLAAVGLNALTWTCSGVCSAASGSGNPSLVVDLAAGAQTEVLLQGSVDAALPFLSLEATISAPAGAPVLNPADDRATLVEAAGAAGLLRDGFESALPRAGQ